MFSTEKTKMCSKFSAASWTLAKSFCESSLPFLSVLVRCTTFARFDLGILAVLWCFVNFGVVSRTFCAAELFFMAPRWGSGHRSLACCSRGSSSRAPLDVSVPPSSKLQALESLARLQHASLATATCWTSWRMCRMHSTKLRTGIWTIRMAR
jgi:hypothetical protein